MIKHIKLAFLLLLLPLMACADQAQFKLDTHYTKINTERSAKPQLTEFFSYYCPHCYKFEGVAQKLKKELPKGVFMKSHVNFMRGTSPKAQSALSLGYLIAAQVGKEDLASDAIFTNIHRNRAQMDSLKDVRSVFIVNDIMSGEEFDRYASSTLVLSQEQYMVEQQARFSQLGALNSVPTFIVNDIYKLNISSISSYEELKALIDYLLAK